MDGVNVLFGVEQVRTISLSASSSLAPLHSQSETMILMSRQQQNFQLGSWQNRPLPLNVLKVLTLLGFGLGSV